MKLENLNDNQKRCYKKAMKALEDVFWSLCNANGPLPKASQQAEVSDVIREFKRNINQLISGCE